MKKKLVVIPIYQSELIIIQDKDWKKVNKKYGTQAEVRFGAFVFRHLKKSGRMQYVVCIDKDPSYSLIAHECVHLTNHLFEDWGIKLDLDNDEPQAYLTGWFFNEIEKFLKE